MTPEQFLQRALVCYGLESAETHFIQDQWNRTYRIVATDGKQYNLRLCPPVMKPEPIRDELIYLDYLAHNCDLPIPVPIRNRDGELLTTINNNRYCCLFAWIDGEVVENNVTLPVIEQIGRITAQLHQLSRQFGFPDETNTFRDDYRHDSTLIASHRDWIAVHHNTIGAENVALMHTAIDYLLGEMARIGRNPHNYGFIHADLHLGNFILQPNGELGILDFDQLGRGHYLFELATLIVELEKEPENCLPRWEHFKRGYQTIAPLPFTDESELDPFIMAVNLAFFDWVYNSPNPNVMETHSRWLADNYASIRFRLSKISEFL